MLLTGKYGSTEECRELVSLCEVLPLTATL